MIARSRPRSGTPHVLAVHGGNVEFFRLLSLVWMLGTRIDAQIAELYAAERPTRQHAFDRLLNHSLGETAVHDLLGGAVLDTADEAGVMVVDLLLFLAAREHGLRRVDDDNIVAIINMRGVGRLVLAAQPHRNDRGEASDHQPG